MFKKTRVRVLRTTRVITLFISFTSAAHAADWPRWQGPDRDAVSRETGLLKEWPKDGPPLAWKVNGIGKGMGGVAVSRGRIYTTGDDAQQIATLYALNESDGKPAWSAKIGPGGNPGNIFKPFGPRATPTVDGDRIYILGQMGDFVCFSTDGKELWRINYIKELGGIMPVWGFAESPLIEGDKIVCTPGAEDATMMALDKATGKPIWKCAVPEGPTGDRGFLGTSGAAYSSVIAIDFEGVHQYVQLTATTLVGVSSDGKLLWRYDRAANRDRINCSTPVYCDGMVFAASAYTAGGGAVKLTKDASGNITATEAYFSPSLKNHHGGIIEVDGYLYLSREPGILTCVEMKTGKIMWSERQPGKGSVVYADDRLYCRSEAGAGTIYLADASPKGYVERGRVDPPARTRESAWPHLVIANGKMYIRDQDVLLCYDVKAK
ncbi:MAG TPA: PQQ-binding-like beta-propeller repeat protein [Humisphaera sp.]|jgi:outer membrane protein assembly factor BamB|nr:PQQ-binding-like beta-propeller repeat protein [Humisphaera sp.]